MRAQACPKRSASLSMPFIKITRTFVKASSSNLL